MKYLIYILFLSFFFTVPSVSFAKRLSGSIVNDLIIEKLNEKGLGAFPSIDRARQFPFCPSPISIESIFGSWKTVQVSCPDTKWKIAVRTNINKISNGMQKITADNGSEIKLIVKLTTSLNIGDVIEEKHLGHLETTKNLGGGIFYKKDQLIGRSLKKGLSVGTIIRARHLKPNWIIEKNQIVIIEHQVGNILITAQGIAQESGQIGQKIFVNNFNSGKKLLCLIKNDKKVTTNAKIY